MKISVAYYNTTDPQTQDFLLRLQEELRTSIGFLLQLTKMIFTPVIEIVFCEFLGENILDKSRLDWICCCFHLVTRRLTTRRIDVEENAEKNRENARLSVKTPTKNVEKVAYSGTHHKKTEYRNHKPRSN